MLLGPWPGNGLVRPGESDAGLARLREFTILRILDLEGTLVSDAGLAHLEGLVNLQTLILSATPVGDPGLVHLKGLKNLQELWLGGAQVPASLNS